jgi:hypothetical protein
MAAFASSQVSRATAVALADSAVVDGVLVEKARLVDSKIPPDVIIDEAVTRTVL